MGFTTQDDKLYLFAFVHFLPGAYNTVSPHHRHPLSRRLACVGMA